MEIIKSCENCVHNVPPMCTGKACGICDAASLKLWRPNYQTLEAELKQYKEALKLACKEIVELHTGSCKDGEEINLMNICLTQAKGGQS